MSYMGTARDLSKCLSLAGDALRYRVTPVVEDPLQVTADKEPVGERAKRAEGNRVANPVPNHRRRLAVGLEGMGVLPEGVWALLLEVGESEWRLPGVDPG